MRNATVVLILNVPLLDQNDWAIVIFVTDYAAKRLVNCPNWNFFKPLAACGFYFSFHNHVRIHNVRERHSYNHHKPSLIICKVNSFWETSSANTSQNATISSLLAVINMLFKNLIHLFRILIFISYRCMKPIFVFSPNFYTVVHDCVTRKKHESTGAFSNTDRELVYCFSQS